MSTRLQEDLTAANSTIRNQQKRISALTEALHDICSTVAASPHKTNKVIKAKDYIKQFGLDALNTLEKKVEL